MKILIALLLILPFNTFSADPPKNKLQTKVESYAEQLEDKVTEWRHYIHQNPELSNREFKTAEYIATHLESLGLEVQTGIAKTETLVNVVGQYADVVGCG